MVFSLKLFVGTSLHVPHLLCLGGIVQSALLTLYLISARDDQTLPPLHVSFPGPHPPRGSVPAAWSLAKDDAFLLVCGSRGRKMLMDPK